MLYLLLSLVFITSMLMVTAIYHYAFRKKQTKRIALYLQGQKIKAKQDKAFKTNFKEAFGLLGEQIMGLFVLKRYRDKITRKLERADISINAQEAISIAFVITIITICLFTVLTHSIAVGLLVAALILILIWFMLNSRSKTRLMQINEQLGDALDLISGSLRTGYSFLRSLEVVANEMPKPISKEFSKMVKEIGVGVPVEKALNNLLDRVPSDDLELLVTAVLIQRHTGGNLAEVIDNISGTIRERIKLKREVKTLTSQGVLSGWIIAFIPVFLAVVISFLDRAYINTLISSKIGCIMLCIAVFDEIIGVLFIKRVLNVKY